MTRLLGMIIPYRCKFLRWSVQVNIQMKIQGRDVWEGQGRLGKGKIKDECYHSHRYWGTGTWQQDLKVSASIVETWRNHRKQRKLSNLEDDESRRPRTQERVPVQFQ